MKCGFAHRSEDLVLAPDFFQTKLCRVVVEGGTCNDPECRYAHSNAEMRKPTHIQTLRDRDQASDAGNPDIIDDRLNDEHDNPDMYGDKSSIARSSDTHDSLPLGPFSRQTTAEEGEPGEGGISVKTLADGGFSVTHFTIAESEPSLSDGGLSSGFSSTTWSRQATPLSVQPLSADSLPKVFECDSSSAGSVGKIDEEQSLGDASEVSSVKSGILPPKEAFLNNMRSNKLVKMFHKAHAYADEEIFSDGPARNLFLMADSHGLNMQLRSTFLQFQSYEEMAEIPRRKTHSAPPP